MSAPGTAVDFAAQNERAPAPNNSLALAVYAGKGPDTSTVPLAGVGSLQPKISAVLLPVEDAIADPTSAALEKSQRSQAALYNKHDPTNAKPPHRAKMNDASYRLLIAGIPSARRPVFERVAGYPEEKL
jgi:hypothetical protein